ncbi:hypothetical protein C21_01604 [Arenibacter sp. NBRC 103722]|nr:hypothetical protein C21_01604 [Arenibacter sp. NBRC 103722]
MRLHFWTDPYVVYDSKFSRFLIFGVNLLKCVKTPQYHLGIILRKLSLKLFIKELGKEPRSSQSTAPKRYQSKLE